MYLTGCLLLLVLPALAEQTGARMYQWRDPVTHSLQLAGKPPPWYRNGQSGPRVKVFERGQLVDDTARHLEPTQAASLRANALGNPSLQQNDVEPKSPPTPESEPPRDNPAALAHFKSLLDAWDRTQSVNPPPAANESSSAAPSPPRP